MRFGEAIGAGYRNFFRLRGTATRPEYWFFALYYFLLFAVALVGIIFVATQARAMGANPPNIPFICLGLFIISLACLALLVSFVTLIPLITAQVRRLHDAGRSGRWLVLEFILELLNALYDRIDKIDHVASVVIVHGILAFAQLGISLVILFFLVQPSAESRDYAEYR